MKKQRTCYKDSEIVYEYMGNKQISNRYDGCHENYMNGDVFTREADYFNEDRIKVAEKRLVTEKSVAGIAEGLLTEFNLSGNIVKIRKFIVDYKKLIETVFNDEKGNGIYEIAKLNRVNFSTKKLSRYYPSRHLCLEENLRDNILHGNVLMYGNSRNYIPKDTVSNVKRNLSCKIKYNNGFMMEDISFNKDGSLDRIIKGNKQSSDDDLFQFYKYNENNYEISFANTDYTYQEDVIEMDPVALEMLLVKRTIYERDQRIVCLETFDYIVTSKMKLECLKKQYFPDKWDRNRRVASGALKIFKDDMLIGNGPFKTVDEEFVSEGEYIFRNGNVYTYQNDEVVKKDRLDVMEQNGELIICTPAFAENEAYINVIPV